MREKNRAIELMYRILRSAFFISKKLSITKMAQVEVAVTREMKNSYFYHKSRSFLESGERKR
ncbi:hypothetical protein C0J52_01460 [Blattella germanica]|nr:hypothetical protein C0J52_01460 [Blattella germanica]